jgi:hypothetical protein
VLRAIKLPGSRVARNSAAVKAFRRRTQIPKPPVNTICVKATKLKFTRHLASLPSARYSLSRYQTMYDLQDRKKRTFENLHSNGKSASGPDVNPLHSCRPHSAVDPVFLASYPGTSSIFSLGRYSIVGRISRIPAFGRVRAAS